MNLKNHKNSVEILVVHFITYALVPFKAAGSLIMEGLRPSGTHTFHYLFFSIFSNFLFRFFEIAAMSHCSISAAMSDKFQVFMWGDFPGNETYFKLPIKFFFFGFS